MTEIADIDRFRFASSRVAVFHVFWRRNALNVWRQLVELLEVFQC